MALNYVEGDVTQPHGGGSKIIAHVVNDRGAMGKGVALALMQRYPTVRRQYLDWFQAHADEERSPRVSEPQQPASSMPVFFARGEVQLVTVRCGSLLGPDFLWVANMVAQDGYRKRHDDPPTRYVDYFALGLCLEKLADAAFALEASIHMPRIGCGLAGGTWEVVGEMVERYLSGPGLIVTVYDVPTVS